MFRVGCLTRSYGIMTCDMVVSCLLFTNLSKIFFEILRWYIGMKGALVSQNYLYVRILCSKLVLVCQTEFYHLICLYIPNFVWIWYDKMSVCLFADFAFDALICFFYIFHFLNGLWQHLCNAMLYHLSFI